ncbi:MAG: hypothetical protein NTU76_03060 [Candidatus Taylorbacteria bacterium]|nr:hypothetical protein [Candidatus Taylorbacteria bacterium]
MNSKLKITICGSIAFHDEMIAVKNKLESMGHIVDLPPIEITLNDGSKMLVKKYYEIRKNSENDGDGWIWDEKEKAMMAHFKKVEWSDVVLILNCDKNNIAGYIGGNTLMEMGLAFFLNKKGILYRKIPLIFVF